MNCKANKQNCQIELQNSLNPLQRRAFNHLFLRIFFYLYFPKIIVCLDYSYDQENFNLYDVKEYQNSLKSKTQFGNTSLGQQE